MSGLRSRRSMSFRGILVVLTSSGYSFFRFPDSHNGQFDTPEASTTLLTLNKLLFQHLLVSLLCLGIFVPGLAFAQDDSADFEEMVKRPSKSKQSRDGKVGPAEEDELQLGVKWELRRVADNEEARDRIYAEYINSMQRLGLPSRPLTVRALLDEAAQAYSSGDTALAHKRVDQAHGLGPMLPMVEFVRTELKLRTTPFDVVGISTHFVSGLEKGWRDVPTRLRWMVRGAGALWLLVSLLGLLMCLVSMRHARLVEADLRRHLPEGVTSVQMLVLLGMVVVTPALLTGSVLPSVIAILLLTAAYMSWPERLVVAALLGSLALMPTSFGLAGSGMNFPSTEVSQLVRWGAEGCQEGCRKTLSRWEERQGEDPTLVHARRFLLVTSALRRGPAKDHSELLAQLEEMSADATLPAAMKLAVTNNIGVLMALTGDLEGAAESFERVVAGQPGDWRHRHNLFRALDQKGDDDAAKLVLKKSIELGGAEAAARSSDDSLAIPLHFHLMGLESEPLFEHHLSTTSSPESPVAQVFWERVGPSVALDSMPIVAGGSLGAFFLMMILCRIFGASKHCENCNGPRRREDLVNRCANCHFCLSGAGSLTYSQRIEHEAVIGSNKSVRKWLWWVGNIVFPGSGAALCGVPFGLVPLSLAALAVSVLVWRGDPLGDPWLMVSLWEDGTRIVGWGLLLVAATFSFGLLGLGKPYRAPVAAKRKPSKRKPSKREMPAEGGQDGRS